MSIAAVCLAALVLLAGGFAAGGRSAITVAERVADDIARRVPEPIDGFTVGVRTIH